jgi:hypothetical protein
MLGFQENNLKFLRKMWFWWGEVQSISWGLWCIIQIQGTMSFVCASNDSPTQKCFKYALITLLINLCNWGDQKKFMSHSFSSHPKPPTSLVLLHKTKEHSSSCCHFTIVVEIKELHHWNLASNLKPHEPWVESTLVYGTTLYYKMSFHSIPYVTNKDMRHVRTYFVSLLKLVFNIWSNLCLNMFVMIVKNLFGCSNFHVCKNTLIIRRLQKKKSHGKTTTCIHFIDDFTLTITTNFEFIMIFAFVTILRFASKMMGMRMALWEVLLITDNK